MKAVIRDGYGGPEVLRVADEAVPEPRRGEVRVKVLACSVNLSDWEALTGRPLYARMGGVRRPRRPVLGSDIVGEVDALGPEVAAFAVGDRVAADVVTRPGGFTEFACLPVADCALVPAEVGNEEAACLPQSGAIAVQGTAGAEAGRRVLINGAGGGSGTFALQLATAAGALVTAVDNAGKQRWLRELGAETVLDYRRDDFTRSGVRHDLVLDLVATRGARAVARALAAGGSYRAVGGDVRTLASIGLIGPARRPLTGTSIGILAVRTGADVTAGLLRLAVEGRLRPVVDEVVTLDRVPGALARVGRGDVRGKIVVLPT
jgi:NADPH:quinone reductase-like Zn-dependent oxidoreductase